MASAGFYSIRGANIEAALRENDIAGRTIMHAVPGDAVLGSKPLTNFYLAIAGIAIIVALAVISASMKMTERSIGRAVEQREAAGRFLAAELSVLRMMAISSESPVPARLYLGIEECFRKNVAVPFDSDEAGRRTLALCAQMEIGRLHSQGGAPMAEKGRALLGQIGLLN
jgi:hypothetical protein